MIKDLSLIDKKSGYIDFLEVYSFGENKDIFYKDIFSCLSGLKDPDVERVVLGIIISTADKESLLQKKQTIEKLVIKNYLNYSESYSFKFLDFVLSQDFGKITFFDREWFSLIIKILKDNEIKISDELAAYVLKTLSFSEEIKGMFYKELGYKKFVEKIFYLVERLIGKTGGLLKDVGFNLRRLPDSKSIQLDCLNIFDFFLKKEFNSQLKYSAYCIFSKIFYFNKLNLVKLLLLKDKAAAKMIFAVQKGSKVAWSQINDSLSSENLIKYKDDIFNSSNLCELYFKINNNIGSKSINGKSKKVGIIITTHNPDLSLLEQSIRSVLLQTYKNISVCIIDDCSDEEIFNGINKIIEKLNDSRIFLQRNERNVGQYVSRNFAMQRMPDVDYYAIQDDDDVSHSDRLRVQLEYLESHKEKHICMTQQVRFNQDVVYVPDRHNPLDFDYGPASSFFRSQVVKLVGDFMPVRSRGDVEFINRIKNKLGLNSVGYLKIPLYIMRSDISTVSSVRDFYFKTQIDVYKKKMKTGFDSKFIQFAIQ